jgi:hypothetical protein
MNIPARVIAMPAIATSERVSPKRKNAVNAAIAGLNDISSIDMRGPISLNALKRAVSPITRPMNPLIDKYII